MKTCLRFSFLGLVVMIAVMMVIFSPCCGAINSVHNTHVQSHADFKRAREIRPDASLAHHEEIMHNNNVRSLQLATNDEETVEEANEVGGSDECPCIDSSRILSTISDCVTDTGSPGFTSLGGCYPLDYGNTCAAHDMKYDPLCSIATAGTSTSGSNNNSATTTIPSYCDQRWCYVDLKKCKNGNEFFYRSTYVQDSRLSRNDLFYSYSTCSSTAQGWLDYQTRSSVEGITLQFTIPRMRYPDHFKYTEEGDIATDNSYYHNDNIPWAGTVIDYLNAVVAISNMRGVNFTSRSRSADLAHPESSYTASVHDVSAGISDAGAATFWITSERLSMTTFSTPFGVDRMHLFVKQPEQHKGTVQENAEKILMPFTINLWILLLGVIVVTAILIVCLDRTEGEHGIWNNKTSGPYWNKASAAKKIGIVLKSSIDSFLIHSSHMLGHSVEFDPFTSMAQKILYFGFAVVIFIAVAAYTANLAAFLTLSNTVNYVSNMDEAIATNTPVCANPVLEEEYAAAWPGATFIFNHTAERSGYDSLMGMMAMYDAGKCGAIGIQFETFVLTNLEIMNEFCQRDLVSTGSYIIEKPLAFPIRSEFAAGLSYWLYEAEKHGISFQHIQSHRLPSQLCNLRVSMVSPDVDELLSLDPASMILPTLIWICSIAVAILVYAWSFKKKRTKRLSRRNSESPYPSSNFGDSAEFHRVSYLSPNYRKRSTIFNNNNHQSNNNTTTTTTNNNNNRAVTDLLQRHHTEILHLMSEINGKNDGNQELGEIDVESSKPGRGDPISGNGEKDGEVILKNRKNVESTEKDVIDESALSGKKDSSIEDKNNDGLLDESTQLEENSF